jgi:16S rRNA G527 N7-methylase RsmG
VARPGLRVLLVEASHRRSGFLRMVLRRTGMASASVLPIHVQRPSDLQGIEPLRVLTTRAMGGWAKILPRLGPCLREDGEMLVWAGEELVGLAPRVAWRRLRLVERRPLPGRECSWIWRVLRADNSVG